MDRSIQTPTTGGSDTDDSSVSGAASRIAQTAGGEARQVAGTAADEARRVVDDARRELHDQATTQSHRLAGALRQAAGQLHRMSDAQRREAAATGSAAEPGMATRAVAATADRLEQVGQRLDTMGPDGVGEELRRFARRRPGAFLAVAAGAGFLTGRLVRNAAAGPPGDPSSSRPGDAPFPGTEARPWYPDTGYADAPMPALADTGAGFDTVSGGTAGGIATGSTEWSHTPAAVTADVTEHSATPAGAATRPSTSAARPTTDTGAERPPRGVGEEHR